MTKRLCSFIATLALATLTLHGQNAVQELRADLLTGPSSTPGRIILAGEQLVFISDANPADSFFVARSNVQSINPERDTITVQLRDPMRDRSGERLRPVFRLLDERSAQAAAGWHARGASPAPAAGPAPAADDDTKTYQARHKKRFGGSSGRLIVSDNGMAYESIDNASSSRRWELQDIRELKLKNPYELDIVAAGGERYTLELQGQGMDAGDYRSLVDRITKARAGR